MHCYISNYPAVCISKINPPKRYSILLIIGAIWYYHYFLLLILQYLQYLYNSACEQKTAPFTYFYIKEYFFEHYKFVFLCIFCLFTCEQPCLVNGVLHYWRQQHHLLSKVMHYKPNMLELASAYISYYNIVVL